MDYVFLHGGGQGGWVWDQLVDALKLQTGGEFGRALALDVPGCGTKRGRNTDGLTVEAIAEELLSDVKRAGFKDVFIIGHSQAGTVIPMMLAARPDLFSQVLYVSCVAPAMGKTVQSFRSEMYSNAEHPEPPKPTSPAEISKLIRHYMCNDMHAAEADALMEKMGKDKWPLLSYAKNDWRYDDAPPAHRTIYVMTLQDTGVPVLLQDIFAKRLKAETIIRMDCGHQAMNTRPQALAEIILRAARRANVL